MGRKKLEIKYREVSSQRLSTFIKRRDGLCKKAREISTLTHCGIVLIVIPEVEMIRAQQYLEKYGSLTDALSSLRTSNTPTYHEQCISALERQDGLKLMEIVSEMEKSAAPQNRSHSPTYVSLFPESQPTDEEGETTIDDAKDTQELKTTEYFSHPYDVMCMAQALYPASYGGHDGMIECTEVTQKRSDKHTRSNMEDESRTSSSPKPLPSIENEPNLEERYQKKRRISAS